MSDTGKYAHGGKACAHCGGEVMEDGFAVVMREDGEGEVSAAIEGVVNERPEQGEAGEEMREAAFVDAIKRRRAS